MKKIILLISVLVFTFSVNVFAQPITIKDLADVQTKMEQTDGQLLQWEASTGLWKPITLSDVGNFNVGGDLDIDGDVTLSTVFHKHISIPISSLVVGPTVPASTAIGTYLTACHDDTGNEISYISTKVPHDWDGISDISLHFHWVPNATIANGDTVIWSVDVTSYLPGDIISNGSPDTYTVTITIADDDGTQYTMHDSNIDMSRVGSNQTIIDDEILGMKFSSTAADTSTEDICIVDMHLHYDVNKLTY